MACEQIRFSDVAYSIVRTYMKTQNTTVSKAVNDIITYGSYPIIYTLVAKINSLEASNKVLSDKVNIIYEFFKNKKLIESNNSIEEKPKPKKDIDEYFETDEDEDFFDDLPFNDEDDNISNEDIVKSLNSIIEKLQK